MPVDGVHDEVVARQVGEPLPERPPLRDHELHLPPVLHLGRKVDDPDEEEDRPADYYLQVHRPVGWIGEGVE